MSDKQEKAIDQILDLLLDALNERRQVRALEGTSDLATDDPSTPAATRENEPPQSAPAQVETDKGSMGFIVANDDGSHTKSADADMDNQSEEISYADAFKNVGLDGEETKAEEEAEVDLWSIPAEPLPTINMNRVFYRMALALLLIVIVVNIPFNRYGTNLARAMPDERALIVRDGLLFKGPGDEIYILEGNKKRWISSLTAFELHHFRWDQVHEVDQAFVDQFPDGPAFHVLIRCSAQPHIYLLEGKTKRWIENPHEFEAAGFRWEEVRYISCPKLKRDFPDGIPIPPDAGEPPSW